MAGAPSQLDLFDYKPELEKNHLKPCPDELVDGKMYPLPLKGLEEGMSFLSK